mmetsp:Transcript_75332/g.125526  ORF Transcript_75332/g.125526 Transcript_75332/m.125526 type:complete len:82 (-) Transcript_75332:302-547(-)
MLGCLCQIDRFLSWDPSFPHCLSMGYCWTALFAPRFAVLCFWFQPPSPGLQGVLQKRCGVLQTIFSLSCAGTSLQNSQLTA